MNSPTIDGKQRLLGFLLVGLGIGIFLFAACLGVTVVMVIGACFYLLPPTLGRILIQILILGVCGLAAWYGIKLVRAGGRALGCKSNKGIFAGLSVLVVAYALAFYFSAFPFVTGMIHMSAIMETVGYYMDSLTPSDIQAWIDRSKKLMAQQKAGEIPEGYIFKEKLPEDLKKLNIALIYVSSDNVEYQWVGGLDHTELVVEKQDDGTFQVRAVYNDYKSKVIWPKQ